GEGSETPTEPHHTPSHEAQPSSLTHISTSSIPTVISIPTVTQSEPTPLRQYTRRTRIAQSSALPPVADEPASHVRDVSKGEAFPTDSGFIADQDRETIAKSSTLPHDTAPWVTSPAAIEGRVIGARSTDDAPINGRRLDEEEGITRRVSSNTEEIRMDEREVAVERTSEDTEEMATVLTSMDAATVLVGGIDVPTGSCSIPTTGPPAEDKRMTKKIARDAEEARIHAEEELQGMIDSLDRTNETIAKNNLGWKVKDFKGMTFEEIEAKFAAVWKLVEDFIPMGSKEEAERLKRKGFNLEQEKAKKQKTSEEVLDKEKSPKEIPEEKVKEMMQLIPIKEVQGQRDLHASRKRLSSQKRFSTCDDQLQASEDPDLSFQHEELKKCLEIIPDDRDAITIDATPLSFKSLTIVDYKIYKEGKKNYF
nr:hypothetical protein [Tanacetum cinerariifolium]